MKTKYVTGDALKGPEKLLIQGCNAQGAMGSGFAKAIRAQYPEVFVEYSQYHKNHGLELGEIVWVYCGDGRIIANGITQKFYGRDSRVVYASYDAIREVFKGVEAFIVNYNKEFSDEPISTIGTVLIGAGLANGSWKIISEIIEKESVSFTPVVYLLDGIIPTS